MELDCLRIPHEELQDVARNADFWATLLVGLLPLNLTSRGNWMDGCPHIALRRSRSYNHLYVLCAIQWQ